MSAPKPTPTHKQRDTAVYYLMGTVGVLLLVIAYFVAKDGFLYYLFKELGFALVVAVALIFTIERFTRELHEAAAAETMDQINGNLFYAIYRRYIPEAVFEEVEKLVMEANVFRRGHELNYTIEDGDGDTVRCLAQTTYTLESVVDSPVVHHVVVRLELPIDAAYINDCYIESLKIGSQELDRASLERFIVRDAEHCVLTYPIQLQPRASMRVTMHSRLVKKATDVEVWASRIPSDGLKLTVSTPSKRLEVCATANHAEKLEAIVRNEGTNSWSLPFGIFPYQSIMFWWKPKAGTLL